MHILFCMHSLCGVLPSGGSYRFVNLVVLFVSFRPTFFSRERVSGLGYFVLILFVSFLLIAEKLWTGLENFVFDWLINADR